MLARVDRIKSVDNDLGAGDYIVTFEDGQQVAVPFLEVLRVGDLVTAATRRRRETTTAISAEAIEGRLTTVLEVISRRVRAQTGTTEFLEALEQFVAFGWIQPAAATASSRRQSERSAIAIANTERLPRRIVLDDEGDREEVIRDGDDGD